MNDNEIKNGLHINAKGDKEWYLNGILHRDNDLPAVEQDNGEKHWFLNEMRHRENDLPAVEKFNGNKEWWTHGNLHREDGPAIELNNGDKEWWINNIQFTEAEFNHVLDKKKLNEKLNLTLKNKPTEKRLKI